jgi:hypothetical protein
LVGVLAVGFVLAMLAAPPAAAEVEGPCEGHIDGQDVAPLDSGNPDDAVDVDAEATITVGASSATPIESYEVQMEFAGFTWTVASDSVDDTQWTDEVDVADYSRFGVGLYKVIAVSEGEVPCSGAVLVNVTGKSPLTTPAGIAGVVLVAGGAFGVAASARKGRMA